MESIESLNQRLSDHFGLDTTSNRPMFRIVWSNDQTEKRMVDTLDSGIHLLFPEIREVKKYSHIKDFYVLERLVIIPEFQQKELAGLQVSYEPLWVFRDARNNPLPPKWEVAKIIVDTLYAALGKKSLAKYKEDVNPDIQEKRIAQIQEELFGDESGLYGKTVPGAHEGIVVPSNYGE